MELLRVPYKSPVKRQYGGDHHFEQPHKIQRLSSTLTHNSFQCWDGTDEKNAPLPSDVQNNCERAHAQSSPKVIPETNLLNHNIMVTDNFESLPQAMHENTTQDTKDRLSSPNCHCQTQMENKKFIAFGISSLEVEVQSPDGFSIPASTGSGCPECAAGKPGHIRHIGRWQLMDSS